MPESLVEQVPFPPQVLEGGGGLVDATAAPTQDGLTGDGPGLQTVGSEEAVAHRRDGHLLEGVKGHFRFELPLEIEVALFEQADVRLAVLQEFFLEIEHVLFARESGMPFEELVPVVYRRAVRHVVLDGW